MEVNKPNSVRIVNLSSYEKPEVKEYSGKEYVTYGKKNEYFNYLIDNSRGSATNGAIINSIVDYIYGKGLTAKNKSQKPNEYAMLLSMFSKETVRNCVSDLKMLGQCALQIAYKGGHKSILSVKHLPVETLAAEKVDEDGEINAYYYAQDWSKVDSPKDTERIPAFGTSNEGLEILYIKPYRSGLFYYSNVDYQGGLQYADLESEIANYHINNIKNGLAPSMLINFNNGVPDEQGQIDIENKIRTKFSGSTNAGRFILNFSDNKEAEGTITPIPLSDASEQYQFLSTECSNKLIVAHRVTSPLLMGLSTITGFGNNADELETSSVLFEALVIQPFRDLLIDNFDKVLAFNKIDLELEFESLNPFSKEAAVDVVNTGGTQEPGVDAELVKKEKEAQAGLRGSVGGVQGILGIQASVASGTTSIQSAINMLVEIYGFAEPTARKILGEVEPTTLCTHLASMEFEDKEMFELLDTFGEKEDLYEWEIVDEREVDYDAEDALDKMIGLANTGKASPDRKSEQDGTNANGDIYKVRYQYAPLKSHDYSRTFCKMMVNAAKIYRKEDIIAMENQPVNPGWGQGGAATYSIWKYKGGGACMHKWYRKTYVRRKGENIKSIADGNATEITTTESRSEGFKPPVNEQEVPVAPHDMKDGGFTDGRKWNP
jgi:hypothetical protein